MVHALSVHQGQSHIERTLHASEGFWNMNCRTAELGLESIPSRANPVCRYTEVLSSFDLRMSCPARQCEDAPIRCRVGASDDQELI